MKGPVLRWYMRLPRQSIGSYTDFNKKFIRHFSNRRHQKTSTTTLFNTKQVTGGFSTPDFTNDVEHPDHKQFADAFANGLRGGHFNEPLAYRPASNMQEVLARAEVYMKGEESNAEKRDRDAREAHSRRPSQEDFQRTPSQRRGPPPNRSDAPSFTTLNQKRGVILKEVMHARLVFEMTPTRRTLGRDPQQWCEYHKARGHGTEDCFTLKSEIEKLIRKEMLKKFVKDDVSPSTGHQYSTPQPKLQSIIEKADEELEEGKIPPVAHILNTIAGGFAGGCETNSAGKRYVMQVMHVAESPNQADVPNLSFSPKDLEGVGPHEDDPLVVII